ncbi:MAG: polymerase subunit sigma-70 [Solirubrobacterales bacterium]|jgi:RNA polymerase sigma-70 factor (ECF subfamily)|nr:polymerase subunit sigma-70 [Solirubrobacterales bacterium]
MTRPLGTPVTGRAPEHELVGRAQAGDVAAFEALAVIHAARLYAVVLRFVGDGREAEDVLQETLLRAWRGIGSFTGRAMVFTWLYRIAVNESNRALERRLRRRATVPVDEEAVKVPAPPHEGPADRAEQRELREVLELAIAELDPPYRTALVLRDVEGLSTRDAAKIAGVGEAAFKSRLHQARLKVRAAVGDTALVAAARG